MNKWSVLVWGAALLVISGCDAVGGTQTIKATIVCSDEGAVDRFEITVLTGVASGAVSIAHVDSDGTASDSVALTLKTGTTLSWTGSGSTSDLGVQCHETNTWTVTTDGEAFTDVEPDFSTVPPKDCVAGETLTLDGTDHTLAKDGPSIVTASATLTQDGFDPIAVRGCDWLDVVIVDVFQTDVDVANAWDEQHLFVESRNAAYTNPTSISPATDTWEMTLSRVDDSDQVIDGSTTLFADGQANGLIYVARAYKTDQTLVDGVLWGHDANKVFAGTVSSNVDHRLAEITTDACRVLTP